MEGASTVVQIKDGRWTAISVCRLLGCQKVFPQLWRNWAQSSGFYEETGWNFVFCQI